jgi:hypothetical protein
MMSLGNDDPLYRLIMTGMGLSIDGEGIWFLKKLVVENPILSPHCMLSRPLAHEVSSMEQTKAFPLTKPEDYTVYAITPSRWWVPW